MNAVTPARQQREPRPALAAQRLLGLPAREGEGEQQVRGEKGLDQGDLALTERDGAQHHAGHHQPDTAEPARHLHQIEEQPRGEEVAQRGLTRRVLLQHKAEAQAAGSTHGESQNQNRHAAYLDRPAGRRGGSRRL
ncbi:hypothetical protein M2159_006505 [Streptomyces sp. SAI-090]|nr:hypothetical protein [Streptomyces sp. SAI-090]